MLVSIAASTIRLIGIRCGHHRREPILLLLDPLIDVALEPLVDVPLEPTTGVLGATGALLGTVLPVEVLGGSPPPNGVTLGIAVGADGRMRGRATDLLGDRPRLATHRLIHLLLCSPM
jgi:hypothetical protein